MQNKKWNFIVIDDSKLDCFIAEKIIRNLSNCNSIQSFMQAKDALEFITETKIEPDERTIVLLDIQMPIMNGFDFVERFEKLNPEITKNYVIYIISSSINENDLNKAKNFSSVKKFINKPLTSNNLTMVLNSLEQ